MPVGSFRLLSGGRMPAILPAGPWRAVYVQLGAARISPVDKVLQEGEGAAFSRAALICDPIDPDTQIWIWKWTTGKVGAVPAGAALVLSHDVARYRDEPDGTAILRMEEVALHPGVETARHTHVGCGLRVIVAGHIDAEVGERHLSLSLGDCWLERGADKSVIGRAGAEGAAFVRVMVLTDSMQGQDSYRPWGDDTDRRGRPASYKKFFEAEVN